MRWQASSSALEAELATPAVFLRPARSRAYLDCGHDGLVGTIELPGSRDRDQRDGAWSSGGMASRLVRVLTGNDPSLGGLRYSRLRRAPRAPADHDRLPWLGVEHILTGFDHLLFVIALTLLVRGGRKLLGAVTAFTVAPQP